MKPISDLKTRAIITLYQNNFGYEDIRDLLSVGKGTISRTLNDNNIEIREPHRQRISEEEMNMIQSRIDKGEYKQDIARDLGITPSALSKRLARR